MVWSSLFQGFVYNKRAAYIQDDIKDDDDDDDDHEDDDGESVLMFMMPNSKWWMILLEDGWTECDRYCKYGKKACVLCLGSSAIYYQTFCILNFSKVEPPVCGMG